ncbi:short-chain dehydrogenase/reductase SDR [Vibrio ichthyoenteri ATCC 700023]|uniref:Short-chain dehydrogenase/reductase SDR n=1 Tax=Vibrio ichthyoenteri ATCC 700023 TaxID=870968 RepID=F9S116_9VIBR|nr:SDR family NAD(P)-dependent oxidoreductase [Vibrio ichthyoenteri]EGU42681.1 short-chain dehydrogenase/reductase SDR [Vibrio ichthyoenteri ATCC 700023]
MNKTILITGATDGIGLETAKVLVGLNHHVIVHGRTPAKVQDVEQQLQALNDSVRVDSIVADLSDLTAVRNMAVEVSKRFDSLDVLINNAGVYTLPVAKGADGLDTRFLVNTIAPYMLTKALMPLLKPEGRVVNLSSAAQTSVNLDALTGKRALGDSDAYAQSKLALTMWSRSLGQQNGQKGPIVVSVNPKSFLGSKMVKDAYGVDGGDLSLGADILVRAAVSDEFSQAHGLYFDNDIERFAQPHPDALNDEKVAQVIANIDNIIASGT